MSIAVELLCCNVQKKKKAVILEKEDFSFEILQCCLKIAV